MQTSSPQAEQMAHESMVRTLAAQAEAIWPSEAPLFSRYGSPASILDVGCGTGEISARLAELFPDASLLGVDLEPEHLERARERCKAFGGRVSFRGADALGLGLPSDSYDLVVCRHLLQAVPDASRALAEMRRVARPGGWLHLIAEDYGMLWCHPAPKEVEELWDDIIAKYAEAIGCDVYVGRKMFTLLSDLALRKVSAEYVVVDTLRVPREVLARIWDAWREGYTEPLARHSGVPAADIERRFRAIISCVRDPRGYALWQVPVWAAQKP